MDEIEVLMKIGLTKYESEIYLAILFLGPSTAREINHKSGVPKNKVYELLKELAKKGIIEILPKSPKKYLIKNPLSIKTLIEKKEKELKEIKKEVSNMISKKERNSTFKEIVWIIEGHEAFVEKVKQAMTNTKKENLVLARKIRTDPILIRLTKEAIKKGAKIKFLLPDKIKSPWTEEWKEIGVRIRYLKETPEITFSTFDNHIARINLNLEDSLADPTLWIESAQFVQILREKFKNLWKQAKL